jgi:CRP-like cAMP-binding protein
MDEGALGKEYADGEVICRQGDRGNCMFVIQAGHVVVSTEEHGREIALGEMGVGDIFGEMAIFDHEARSATVRAKGSARVLTLDKRGFLRRVHEDPSFAYRLLEMMSHRIRALHAQLPGRADASLTT